MHPLLWRPATLGTSAAAVAAPERSKWMLRSIWSTLRALATFLGNGPTEDLPSSEPDLGHGMDPDG
jgi:hypothetical protein